MANKRAELSGNGRHEIDPDTGLAYEWIESTLKAVEDAINREANASRETCHALFASCLYRNFLREMRRANSVAMGITRN